MDNIQRENLVDVFIDIEMKIQNNLKNYTSMISKVKEYE